MALDGRSAQATYGWAAHLFAIAMSKPYVDSVFWGDLYDHEGAELEAGGLITGGGRAKPALSRLIAFRKRLRKPLGPPTAATVGGG